MRHDAAQRKEARAETVLVYSLLKKKHLRGWGRRYMRYKSSEKREIIELVERSSLSVRRTLDRLGIPKSTYYGWYERYREGGDAALEDARPNSGKAWNRLPARIRQSIL